MKFVVNRQPAEKTNRTLCIEQTELSKLTFKNRAANWFAPDVLRRCANHAKASLWVGLADRRAFQKPAAARFDFDLRFLC